MFDFKVNLNKLAEELHDNNFADVENFALSVMRKYILSIPNGDVPSIVSCELENLKQNFK